jgi:hypothetical protein
MRGLAYRNADEDAAAVLLERRWFAAFKAASNARAECEALLDAMEVSERAWNDARIRLAELEMLRDKLGEELAGAESGEGSEAVRASANRGEVMPAA